MENTECNSCQEPREDIEERYSFGVYAGKFCEDCCSKYVDRCGLDGEQGRPEDYEGTYYEEDY